MCGAGPPCSSAAGSVPADTTHSPPSLKKKKKEKVLLDQSCRHRNKRLTAPRHAVIGKKEERRQKQTNRPLQHLSMSSEEWSQEFILDWWIDACLVRVALYLR